MKRFFLIFFYLVYFTNGQANVYQIEVLIFSRFTSQYLKEEQWPTIDLNNFNFSNGKLIHSIPPSRFVLNKEQTDLSKNSSYRILLHVAWIQQIINGQLAQSAKRIKGKDVQGTIHISAQHYFDVSLHLLFKKEGVGYFYLSQNCRMRSNEINYIDFPLYGVLIKIIPINCLKSKLLFHVQMPPYKFPVHCGGSLYNPCHNRIHNDLQLPSH